MNGEAMIDVDKIYCGDSAEVLKTFPDGCIDPTVTSPPYDNLRAGAYQSVFDFETIARQLYRVTKPGGVVVWVVGDATINGSETGTSFRQALYFMGCGFNLHDTMIYQKVAGATGSTLAYWQAFEFMYVFSKGVPKAINLISDRKNILSPRTKFEAIGHRKKNGDKKGHREITRKEYGIRNNIWNWNAGALIDINHPAAFPEALAHDHILSWSNPGDLVLDCFAGSGTTLKMAKELGRHWIGIEISEEYCKLCQRRIDAARVPLFVESGKLA